MKRWSVGIVDGNGFGHHWIVSASSKYDALCVILDSWNKESYGMPYGIQKDGITAVKVLLIRE